MILPQVHLRNKNTVSLENKNLEETRFDYILNELIIMQFLLHKIHNDNNISSTFT